MHSKYQLTAVATLLAVAGVVAGCKREGAAAPGAAAAQQPPPNVVAVAVLLGGIALGVLGARATGTWTPLVVMTLAGALLMLRDLPVTEVKLDRSFVSRATDSEMDEAIVAKVAELSHALGLVVVAEGVETGEVLDRLAVLGCDQAQGWHVARPMAADAVIEWCAGLEDPLHHLRLPRQKVQPVAGS